MVYKDNFPRWYLTEDSSLWYCPNYSYPWIITDGPAKESYSFRTPQEALAFAAGRGFIEERLVYGFAAGAVASVTEYLKKTGV